MSEETNQPGYGYQDDEVKVSPFSFGLNTEKVFLKKFEYIPNGGVDGAEQDALDIVFSINGTDKNYRLFPITKAFLKAGGETTDPNAQEFKDAFKDFNAKVFHIVHCFVDNGTYQSTISRPLAGFKDFVTLVQGLLPKDFDKKPLHIFLQYQWEIGANQNRTYLDLPKKMNYGYWVVPAKPGVWSKQVVENPSDDVREALYYTNAEGEKHPFIRNGWFMNSNFAKQLKTDTQESGGNNTQQSQAADTNASTAPASSPANKPAATW